MAKRLLVIGIGLLVIAGLGYGLSRRSGARPPRPSGIAQAAPADVSGFVRALGPRPWRFPEDHGPHPEFQTEWWYYTGNLVSPNGHRFGFQLTFFRRALQPPQQLLARRSEWATGQVYMAHFALSDIGGQGFQAFERLQRGAAGLAGAQALPFQVWLDDWQVSQVESPPGECTALTARPCAYRLQAAQDGLALDLRLVDRKGPILQGDQGLSPKGSQPGQASYYYSLTRLVAQGRVTVAGQVYEVEGLSWMDHEFSTSALSQDQAGWDWFSIQLDDGSELMVFQLRHKDARIDPFSSGALIAPDGTISALRREDFTLQVTDTWTSPYSGATYPAGWRLSIAKAGLELEITPHLADQELNVSYAYWEGAVRVSGSRDGVALAGNGYVELTGYSGAMGGEF